MASRNVMLVDAAGQQSRVAVNYFDIFEIEVLAELRVNTFENTFLEGKQPQYVCTVEPDCLSFIAGQDRVDNGFCECLLLLYVDAYSWIHLCRRNSGNG